MRNEAVITSDLSLNIIKFKILICISGIHGNSKRVLSLSIEFKPKTQTHFILSV